jgi:hypothetical protein
LNACIELSPKYSTVETYLRIFNLSSGDVAVLDTAPATAYIIVTIRSYLVTPVKKCNPLKLLSLLGLEVAAII